MAASTPPTPPDFSHLARRPSERVAIVEHVLNTAELQETNYLEWKTGYDLSTNPGAAATGKHLIGFANRDRAQAARYADGHAYLLLGVEPANLTGVPLWDSADLENWLVRFVGRELRYDIHYVEVGGQQVLFLTVDPPQQADPIYCLQRASAEPRGKTLPEGTIYVRHGGQTDVATAADIARLTQRARATAVGLDLRVELDGSGVRTIGEKVLSDRVRDPFVEREQRSLYNSLPSQQRDRYAYGLSRAAIGESRSRDEYIEEVETYAAELKARWAELVAIHHVEHERSELVAVIVNDTAENYEDVVLELALPVALDCVYTRPREAANRLGRPERPVAYGRGLLASITPRMPVIPGLRPPEPELEAPEACSTLVRFPPLHVRPHTPHRLQRLLLALPPTVADATLPVRWRVTARNTPGQLEGEVELLVPGADRATDEPPEPDYED